jgi:Fe-S cluster assembly protein SufB
MPTYTEHDLVADLEKQEGGYKYGFVTDIEADTAPPGLNEETVRLISAKKNEPEWMLEWRLKAFRHVLTLLEDPDKSYPQWAHLQYEMPDFQAISYYSAPRAKPKYDSLDEVDPELLDTFRKLGISVQEQERLVGITPVAMDVVMDSVSVASTFKEELAKQGIIFCSMGEAVQKHPELVRKYLGRVVPYTDNFYAALNAAVFSDGSFAYIPKGVRCPMELSTYFRINTAGTGQFERTLIVAEEGSYVSYLEGCTAPMRDEHQLHAAVVEILAMDDAEVKYSTVQNWYPGTEEGKGGVYNFVTKRGLCEGRRSKISWTQLETGSAITWKYPSCILKGDDSVGEFYSVAFTKGAQQADTGTKMIHLGKRTRSTIISKGISAGTSNNSYRGLVRIGPKAEHARNFSQCDSLLLGDRCGAHTFPYIEIHNATGKVEHEATTSKVGEEQMFYCQQRGISEQDALNLIVNGYAKEILAKLPMEFAVEAQKLLSIQLEGSVG